MSSECGEKPPRTLTFLGWAEGIWLSQKSDATRSSDKSVGSSRRKVSVREVTGIHLQSRSWILE